MGYFPQKEPYNMQKEPYIMQQVTISAGKTKPYNVG